MEPRERIRHRYARQVLRLLKQPEYRQMLPPLRHGSSSIVVGLLDDTMRSICQRVAALGGSAHLIVPTSEKPRLQSVMLLRIDADAVPDSTPAQSQPVDEESDLGMLLQLVRQSGSLRFHVCSKDTTVRLLDDDKAVMT